jgi:hypothetical protein
LHGQRASSMLKSNSTSSIWMNEKAETVERNASSVPKTKDRNHHLLHKMKMPKPWKLTIFHTKCEDCRVKAACFAVPRTCLLGPKWQYIC